MQRNLLFHFGALGDSVLLWPLLRAIAPVTFITQRSKAKLAADAVEGVEPVDADTPPWADLFVDGADPPGFDASASQVIRVISFVSDGDDPWAENARKAFARANFAFLRARPPADSVHHIGLFHRHQLAAQGMAIQPVAPPPHLTPTGPIVIHPGAGSPDKCWPIDRFEQLADALVARGCNVIFCIGEVERERFESSAMDRLRERFVVTEPDGLEQLARLLGDAALFVGNDSGPTHLAAQLGKPTLALFGPTDPRVWSPVGPRANVIAPEHPAAMHWLAMQSVTDAALKLLGDWS